MEHQKIPTYISIISSTFSGLLHIFIGHPFDTLKTLKQGNQEIKLKTPTHLFKLFNGVSYPMMQNSLINASSFGLNNFLRNKMENQYLSNFCTGWISTFILTPLDKYKIMSQYNKKYDFNIKNIVYSYKKFPIICAREVPATFIYFSSYQKAKEKNIPIFLSGSIAGSLSWLLTYPIDTIKTRIQNESCKTIKEAIQKGGLSIGIQICLFRSFLVNGVNFYSYEKMNKLLMKNKN
jgi:solute carrier family 25 carnitine/acylcarnitine transporter 20/29